MLHPTGPGNLVLLAACALLGATRLPWTWEYGQAGKP